MTIWRSKSRRPLAASCRVLAIAVAVSFASGAGLHADPTVKPKLGPHAITIQQSHDYLRKNLAPDYWALSPFYVPQMSASACSLATVTTLVNALRGLPPLSADELVTQAALLQAVRSEAWASQTAPNGDGVTFEEFRSYVALSLQAYQIDAEVEVFKPVDSSPATLASLRKILTENEQSDDDIVLIHYNQGVITGDWDGPHLSPVGAYDSDARRVLIMDVDRQFYIPYWTSDEKLLEALLRPVPADRGRRAGETGGIVRVTLRGGRVNRDLTSSIGGGRRPQ
jgi:hypothetical protein